MIDDTAVLLAFTFAPILSLALRLAYGFIVYGPDYADDYEPHVLLIGFLTAPLLSWYRTLHHFDFDLKFAHNIIGLRAHAIVAGFVIVMCLYFFEVKTMYRIWRRRAHRRFRRGKWHLRMRLSREALCLLQGTTAESGLADPEIIIY